MGSGPRANHKGRPRSRGPGAASRAPMRALAVVLMSLVALGLPSAVRAQTPAPSATPVPANPNWCPGVPESPPPPGYTSREWAGVSAWCSADRSALSLPQWRNRMIMCGRLCGGARGAWGSLKNPPPKQKYLSTNKPQGPIPLPGSGEGYILPLAPTPATPGATSTPGAPQGSADPPGPIALLHRPTRGKTSTDSTYECG
jgi:hypothetical protein